jgi:hypothetical protein
MDSRQLVETALRVLKAWTYGDRPASTDMDVLLGHALAGEGELPIDELACRIVARECGRVIQDSETERKRVGSDIIHPRERAS